MDTVELPHRFEDADIDSLVVLIADMLKRVIAINDNIPLSPEALTRFHSSAAADISVLDYLRRIVKYTKVEKSCLLITLHYIDQICARRPSFVISSLTVHRFIITSVAVSSKALCDVFCTNAHYAQVGGAHVEELNLLEREFLSFIDWNLTCTREHLQTYYSNLVRSYSVVGAYTQAEASSDSDVDVEADNDEPKSRSRSRSASVSSASSDDAAIETASPATMLRGLHPAASGSGAASSSSSTQPTLEQAAAFAAMNSRESPCTIDVVRREKRAALDGVDPMLDDSPRPRGRRRVDDS
ncbi:cyclin-domain-containing protein [Auricularia subglabra TFB-10046 SS5]|nr:cyclin-domain-containing protein [Auricularia subglabra TFB-10046 SS5]